MSCPIEKPVQPAIEIHWGGKVYQFPDAEAAKAAGFQVDKVGEINAK